MLALCLGRQRHLLSRRSDIGASLRKSGAPGTLEYWSVVADVERDDFSDELDFVRFLVFLPAELLQVFEVLLELFIHQPLLSLRLIVDKPVRDAIDSFNLDALEIW